MVTSRPAVMIRALAPSGATAKVSGALGSTAAVTGAANFAVALPVSRSTVAMLPAEVSASSSPDGARSRPTMRSPAARPVTLWMPDSPGEESLCT